ncbi:MAG: TraR/DksA family transcriptional regulator [Deltaproteobacteria bacterium]|nr:TraR/DksA family transcriptional regulator [Deltaproteobacteria bacterium]
MGQNKSIDRSSKSKKKNIPPMLNNKPVKKTRQKERTDQFRSRFRSHLLEKKKELEKTIVYLRNENNEDYTKISFDGMTDELDRTDREMAAHNYYKFLDRKKNELNRIEALLERIKHDQDFGICEECERPIPEARLMIVPEAVLCVACQQELEKMESRTNFSSSNNKILQYKDEYEVEEEPDNIDDAGLVTKAGSETMSLMDMEEIDLIDLPETPEEEEESTQ